MKKNIWLISQEASTPSTGYGGRSYYLAKELARKGHQVYLILSSSSHMLRAQPNIAERSSYVEQHNGFKVIWLNTVNYDDAHDKRRVLGWFKFAFKINQLKKIIRTRPDTIIYSSPPLIPLIGALVLKILTSARLIFEIRDIWPLTLTEIGKVNNYHPFIVFSSIVERLGYRFADVLVSNLQFAVDHIALKGGEKSKYHWIPNGVCLDELSNTMPCRSAFDIPSDKFIIGYSGSVGVANYLEILIKTADLLRANDDILFVIVGDGGEKSKLVSQASALNLNNVLFLEPVSKPEVQSILARFDICFLCCEDIDLYKFGISPNKLAEYMYASKPVLLSYSGKGEIIECNNAGITVGSGDTGAIVDAIIKLQSLSIVERAALGRNGKNYVLANLTYEVLAENYNEII